jgi:Protein of unknown function (DUF1553)/Protein of unknown function (DUF1549)/Planctomycete cytochrome C
MPWVLVIAADLVLLLGARVDDEVDYVKQIKPILQARCYACHGILKQKSGLRLDTAALAIKGGKNQAVIKPGDVESSLLIDRVSSEDLSERMPPEGEALKPAEIIALRAWIAKGAKAPSDEQPERDPRDHWSFKTPVRPAVPEVENKALVENPIDAFIASGRESRGLTSQRPADKRVWLRRVSIDLIGLPPTREELDAFVADESPEAVDKVVTRLLGSPLYGERWGRHWMDVWRYSDWWGLGAEVRNSQKHIWHWRDWIIESLNADKGYDQMLREMLAADELYPNDLDRLRASGFLARQYFKFNRTSWLDETVEHTSKAMLGLTFNCAKCHDHKYDPFSQVEYYQMRAFFEPYQIRTDAVPGVLDFEKDGIPRAFDCNPDAKTYLHIRGDERNPDKNRTIEPVFPRFLSLGEIKLEPIALPAESYQPGLRPFVVEAHLKLADRRIAEARSALELAKKSCSAAERITAVSKVATRSEAASDRKPLVHDDFSAERPEIWQVRDGSWTYANGKLTQSRYGASRAALRLKNAPPADFEAKLKYTPTGGETWKSVGIRFDVTEESSVLAYLSSYAGGPRSQVSYMRDGHDAFPPEGAQARAIELGKPHELILRVRGTLVNVVVDGEASIAYRLPIPRRNGALELITFDAKADFLSFELDELPDHVVLAPPTTSDGKPTDRVRSVEQLRIAVIIAEKALATSESQPASINARAAADAARRQISPPADLTELIAEAVRDERIHAAAKADEDASRAELDVSLASPENKAEADKKFAAAKAALGAARQAMGASGDSFTPLTGALKTLESNLETEVSRIKPFPKTSTGRRSALAAWITNPKHPLPARVAVNHVWSRHFGRALVPTVFDFGRKGTPPTHPELLDWLAVELIEHRWSMKHIHRLIVTSHTYGLSSSNFGASRETLAADPENRFYWRANPIRMEAQVVRDSLLSLAGDLDLTRGGPPIPANDETSRRRSLYFVHSHNEHQQFLSMFDDASVLECYRRTESIVPQQALALENSPLAGVVAEKISQRIKAANPNASDNEFLRTAFLTVLSVEPSESELAALTEALAHLSESARRANRPEPAALARTHLIVALLNHNDFVTVR